MPTSKYCVLYINIRLQKPGRLMPTENRLDALNYVLIVRLDTRKSIISASENDGGRTFNIIAVSQLIP